MNAQALTSKQYRITNIAMLIISFFNYLLAIGIEYNNGTKEMENSFPLIRIFRIGIYLFIILFLFVFVRIYKEKKRSMVIMAISYVIIYPLLVLGNGIGTLTLAFPALIGFMIYLNSRVVMAGCALTLIVCISKCISLNTAGDLISANIGYTITIIMTFCAVATYIAISLLMRFDKENREIVEIQLKKQKEIANNVVMIVGNLDTNFQKVITEMDNIANAMGIVHDTIDNIAEGSENTAYTVNNQTDMTVEIHNKIKNANEITNNAAKTTEGLNNIIKNGKTFMEDLQKQSIIVDNNTEDISKTMELLVQNVNKVSGITESILNISKQTHLLALNASIEAARAGEHGKGFSVVAEEIRKLAEETKSSTEKITDIINELNKITQSTQCEIEESIESINVQLLKVNEVNQSFIEIEQGIFELSAGVKTIISEMEVVLNANTVIVESVETLSATSEEVSTESQNSKKVINSAFDSLNLFAERLSEALEKLEELKNIVNN